jgi:hypothetical protein
MLRSGIFSARSKDAAKLQAFANWSPAAGPAGTTLQTRSQLPVRPVLIARISAFLQA